MARRAASGRERRPSLASSVIWGHGLINGYDFWRELGRDKTARLIPKAVPEEHAEGNHMVVAAELDLVPPDGATIGRCHQRYGVRSTPQGVVVDAEITIEADHGHGLTFGDTEDGGFGIRFDDAFRQDRGAKLLNSEGLVGSENIWGKRARWVQYSTEVSGKPASVAIFDHPSNFRHPTYWHARDYGLCAANPFGLHDFLKDPDADGSETVGAGGDLTFRYRILVADGVTPVEELERLFSAYGEEG
ncbi:MAG: PmoA family protein [Bryobacterales bacterium]